jgi:hypothetical protein
MKRGKSLRSTQDAGKSVGRQWGCGGFRNNCVDALQRVLGGIVEHTQLG